MKKKIKNIDFNFILVLIALLQPFITQATAIITRKELSIISVGLIYNSMLMILCVIYILFVSKSKYKKFSIISLISIFVYLIFFFSLRYNSLFTSNFISEFKILIKYLYFPILTLGAINVITKENCKSIINVVKVCLFIYVTLILIAIVTGTSYFSYDNSYVGKIGWFYSANEISALMCMLVPLCLINFKKNIFNISLVILSVICILFIGTKTSFLGLSLFVFAVLVYLFIKSKLKCKIIIGLVLIIIPIGLMLIKPPTITNFAKSINNYLENKSNKSIEQSSYASIPFLILSERNVFLKNAIEEYKTATLTNKIIGLGFINGGIVGHLIEMDFFDLVFRYGVVGMLCFSVPLLYLFYRFIRFKFKKKKFNLSSLIVFYSFLISFIISFLAGHVFGAPAVSFYFAIIIGFLINYLDVMEVKDE